LLAARADEVMVPVEIRVVPLALADHRHLASHAEPGQRIEGLVDRRERQGRHPAADSAVQFFRARVVLCLQERPVDGHPLGGDVHAGLPAAAEESVRPSLEGLLRLDPVTGTNLVFVYLAAGLVAVFGYAYLRIAQDPERFRPFIELGVIGKLLAVGAVTWPWLTGEVGWQLPLVVSGDAVF